MHFISVIFIAVIGVSVAQVAAAINDDQSSIQAKLNSDTKKITGGSLVTNRTEYPYHASVQLAATNAHLCSASLIDEQNLLTSAACMYTLQSSGYVLREADTLQVVLGTTQLGQVTDAVTKKLKYVFVHEDYTPNTRPNDISVIRVAEKIDEYTDNVRNINLTAASPGTGVQCTSSGWAYLASSQTNQNLKKVSFSTLLTSSCTVQVNDDEFCGDNNDGCKGETGSPVICDSLQVGIVSDSTCPSTAGPIIDVAYHKDWIEKQQERSGSNNLMNSIYILSFCVYTCLFTYKNL